MSNYRATVLACLSMLVAVGALLIALVARLPVASAAPPQQAPTPSPVRAAAASAAVQRAFNYQGILRKPDGTLADGTFDMTFRLWDAVTGGSQKYTETQTGVPVRNGVFNVVLGDNSASPGGIGADVLSIAPLFLGISVGSDAELQPRQRVNPVPMALTLAPGATIGGDLTVQGTVNTGNVGAGNGVFIGLADHNLALQGNDFYSTNQDVQINSFAGHNLYLNPWPGDNNVGASGDIYLGNGSHTVWINGNLRTSGRAPILTLRYDHVGDNARFDTGVPVSDYRCSTGGWWAFYDIQENGAGTNMVLAYADTGTWHVAVEFNSHNNNESSDVDVICFDRTLVEDKYFDFKLP